MSKNFKSSRSLHRFALSVALLMAFPVSFSSSFAADTPTTLQNQNSYQLPPKPLQDLVDAPRPPQLSLSPQRDWLLYTQTPNLPSIQVVAQPELKLAGMRINPKSYSPSAFSFGTQLELQKVASGERFPIANLPINLSVASAKWSPNQQFIAFNHVDNATGSNELWLVDIETRSARRLSNQPLNTVGANYQWLPNSRGLIVQLRPAGQGAAPVSNGIPNGPAIQQTNNDGNTVQARTYQDLLKNEQDAQLLEHYLRSQIALIDISGNVSLIGAPAMWDSVDISPSGDFLLVDQIERPFSFMVPVSYFPSRIQVLDIRSGNIVEEIAKLPLVEGLPSGNDAVRQGVRNIAWRSDAPATLVWAEAQDGGDPNKKVEFRDAVMMQAAPFDNPPITIARLASRFAGITWGNDKTALLREYWWKTRQTKEWLFVPDQLDQGLKLIREGSTEDRYNDPGRPVTQIDSNGQTRLLMTADGQSIFRLGVGASPEGDRPFLDKVNLSTGKNECLFRSKAPFYQAPQAVLDQTGESILLTQESPETPTNFYVWNTKKGKESKVLTQFPHPVPQLKGVTKEQIRYKRNDGVELTATLYLPPNYDPKRDGALPMLMWAYPQEFKSAEAASQVSDSPYKFNRIGYWGPHPFLAMGYAVLDNPSMPIVGEGNKEPNDTYIQQLVASAQAAVDEVVRRGVTAPDRIAIGGHSYGAFMTANLLAHSRLFKAGIARSGAYNRTLTPFGFQSEERNFWQATDVYQGMSPFNFANQIKDPMLMIHGEQDNNSGTFPIQSERMFAAIKGLGGNARLVMLPNESHGYRARESILHMLAETNQWLEQYVKPASKKVAKVN